MGPIYSLIIDALILGFLSSKLLPKYGTPEFRRMKTNRGKCYFCGRTRKKHKARDFACRNYARSIQTSRLSAAAVAKAPQYVQVPDRQSDKVKQLLTVLTVLAFLMDPAVTEREKQQQSTPENKVYYYQLTHYSEWACDVYFCIEFEAAYTFFQDYFWTQESSDTQIPQSDGNNTDLSDDNKPDSMSSRDSADPKVIVA